MFKTQQKSLHVSKFALLTSATWASLSLFASPALATPPCAGATTSSNSNGGTDFTYSNAQTAPCEIYGNDTLTVTNTGSLITASDPSITAYDSGTVITNHGTITASTTNTIDILGSLTTLTNTGTLSTPSSGYVIHNAGTIGTINNNGGDIDGSASGEAIHNDSGATITTISNTNSGTIIGSGEGIYSEGDIGTITNGAESTISSLVYTIWSSANGTIGTINNAGTIEGDYTISNDGDSVISNIINSGTITGTGRGIYNGEDSTITSITNTGDITGTGGSGQGIENRGGHIGTITNESTGTISSEQSYGIENNTGGTIGAIINHGMISSGSYGILNGSNSVITSLVNSGTISSGSHAIYGLNDSTIHIDNTGGTIESDGNDTIRLRSNVTWSLNNTNGIISADNDSAIEFRTAPTTTLENTGGLITSASTSDGTFFIVDDLGADMTVHGGTISNTWADNNAIAVEFDEDQSNTITFDGVNIIADGETEGSGHGYAFFSYEYDMKLNLTSTTNVRGNIYLDCCGNLELTTSANILGNIETNGNYEDNVTVNGGSITGDITLVSGADTLNLNGGTITGTVDMGGGDDTVTLDGGIINGNLLFGSGSNILNASGDYTTGGTIGTTGSTDLSVYGDSTFTVAHSVGLGSGYVDIDGDSTLFLSGGNLTTTGTLYNAGTTHIATGRTLSVGNFDSAVSGNMIFNATGVSGNLTSGLLSITNSSSANLTNQVLSINYTGGLLNEAASSRIVDGSGGASTLPSADLTDNSYLYDFGLELRNANQDVYVVLTGTKSLSEAANTPNNLRIANQLFSNLDESDDTTIQQILNNLGGASSQAEFNRVLEAAGPTVDNGNQTAAIGMTGAMFDLADGQLSSIQTGGSGASSGDSLKGLHFWMQAFGSTANQGERDGIAGYDASVGGLAIGGDTRNFRKDTTVGMSLGYARTDVDSKNANHTNTDVDSYQLMGYANHDLGNNNFLNGMALFGWNSNDQTRYNVGGIGGLNADADYNSWTGGLRAAFGHNYTVASSNKAFKLSPQIFTEYVHFDREAYSETGAGGANLHVGSTNQDILNLGTSLQAELDFKAADGSTITPDIHVSYRYNALDDQADTTASFAAGGTTYAVSSPGQARSALGIGAGVKMYKTNGWDFTANYDYTYKEDYSAHSGLLRAAYQF